MTDFEIEAEGVAWCPVERIVLGERLRQPSEEQIARIAGSMKEIGMRNPITVELVADRGEMSLFQLRAGYTRLLAAKRLGWATVPVNVQEFESEEQAELWEIDENLMRGELSPAEQAMHLARRKEIFELMGGKIVPTLGGEQRVGFAQDTSKRTGETKRSINEKVARGEALRDCLKDVVGTSLDKGTELDALARMPPEGRRAIITAARHGAPVSAIRQIRSDHDVLQDQKDGLMRAWNRAVPEVREWFREVIERAA